MNRIHKFASAFIIIISLLPVFAQTKARSSNTKDKLTHPARTQPVQSERGQTVFEQNCSRCHNAPQGFPPQIAATIIRHMRVRASLSSADEKALLRFMNP